MSCSEWESGSIVIPTAAWPRFKQVLRTGWNTHQDVVFAYATGLHARLLKAAEGTRNTNWRTVYKAVVDAEPGRHHRDYTPYATPVQGAITDLDRGNVLCVLFPYGPKPRMDLLGAAGRPLLPKRKDFPHANGATKSFYWGDGEIQIQEESHTVLWQVPENNHAREHARAHPMAQVFFTALRSITWTRGSGGEIVGNDEYNRENHDSGGGANYTIDTYGPKTAKTTVASYGAVRRSSVGVGRFAR